MLLLTLNTKDIKDASGYVAGGRPSSMRSLLIWCFHHMASRVTCSAVAAAAVLEPQHHQRDKPFQA